MLGRGIRFADVFVPGAMTNVSIGNVTVASMQGVWRRVLYFGRGIGGKYVTALDVTAPGPYTANALSTVAPIPLWSRGNPDTQDGLASGVQNGSSTDADAYARMGETWSMPTVVYTNSDKTNPLYVTTRRPDGIDFAIFMGSGYGNPNAAVREGTTHYTLDALSGDVIAAVDVEDVAASYGLTRSGLSYPNAIVANSVSFNRSAFMSISAKQFNVNPHPGAVGPGLRRRSRRLWKF
jgi:Tfp pilus tip-associated adhesin PilY1